MFFIDNGTKRAFSHAEHNDNGLPQDFGRLEDTIFIPEFVLPFSFITFATMNCSPLLAQ